MKHIHPVVIALCALSACQQAPNSTAPETRPTDESAFDWTIDVSAPPLRAASCPSETGKIDPSAIEVVAAPIAIGPPDKLQAALPEGVAFVAGWRLSSEHPAFGGLSGLAQTPAGDLLAVSDAGAFVELDMEDGEPTGEAKLTYMLDDRGLQLSSKEAGDAEGLALRSGLALVSFEQDFRIMAFALEACGAATRGVKIAGLPGRIDGRRVRRNNGPEALDLTDTGALMFGYERGGKNGAVRGVIQSDGSARFTGDTDQPAGYSQVGMTNGGRWTLFRSYGPVRGNRNIVDLGDGRQIQLLPPLLVDNFEGIAAGPDVDATRRMWLISDDNFSDKQQTLLYAFDVQTPSR
jgi:hypothetical protein